MKREQLVETVDYMQVTGGMIAVFGYIPQIVRILRTRKVDGVSMGMWVAVFTGIVLTEFYAFDLAMDGRPTVLLTNSLSMVLCATLIVLIAYFGRAPRVERVALRVRASQRADAMHRHVRFRTGRATRFVLAVAAGLLRFPRA